MEKHTYSAGCVKYKQLKAWLLFTECSISVLKKGVTLKLSEAGEKSGTRALKPDERRGGG